MISMKWHVFYTVPVIGDSLVLLRRHIDCLFKFVFVVQDFLLCGRMHRMLII